MSYTTLLIDANSVGSRAYYAGNPYSFFSMVETAVTATSANGWVFAFDSGNNFRKAMYPEYKANRDRGVGHGLKLQYLRMLWRALNVVGIKTVAADGFEADDVIATLTKMVKNPIVVSSDKDLYALANIAHIFTFKRHFNDWEILGPKQVFEQLKVRPEQVVDYKALSGDQGDNIPGVTGIGPVYAKKLLTTYGNLDNIYANLTSIEPKRLRQRLTAQKQQAYDSRNMAALRFNVPVGDLGNLDIRSTQGAIKYLRQNYEYATA